MKRRLIQSFVRSSEWLAPSGRFSFELFTISLVRKCLDSKLSHLKFELTSDILSYCQAMCKILLPTKTGIVHDFNSHIWFCKRSMYDKFCAANGE